MQNESLGGFEDKLKKSVDALKKDLSRLRTGVASPSLLEDIRVTYYDQPTPLNQVASISSPDSRTIAIQPWDASAIGEIEKAIQKSDLGVNPINDGKMIRLVFPKLTEERRRELVKQGSKMVEATRVSIRNIRRDMNEKLKKMEKDKTLSKDDLFKLQEDVQKMTDRYISLSESIYSEKEKENPSILTADIMDFKQEKLPLHVAIIMDGNGRWATQRSLPRIEGHMAGIESVREAVTATREIGIPYLTLYAFSKENWSRPKEEVQGLLHLLELYLHKELPMMMEHEIRFRAIGALDDLPKRLQTMLNDVMEKTEKHKALTLNIALSYSGRQEILQAVRSVLRDMQAGLIKRIDEKIFARYLYTDAMRDPDLLIRTSGEMRLSNFLLWQMAYTEIYVTETLWPDFRREAYEEALMEFTRRERRFGSLKEY